MSVFYEITHRTVYQYAKPVRFGEHRVLFRPRESHDLRVLATDLRTNPPAAIRRIQDPQCKLTAWARQFVRTDGPTETRAMLVRMNQHIRDTLRDQVRHEEGTQAPLTTLELGSGTCRNFALLMMGAMRRLGVAARFVSGYLYDASLEGAGPSMVGSGSPHAWLQGYLPGAGWVPFDPTNNLLGGTQLIGVGVARHPAQVAPVAGSWFGKTTAYKGMTVDVRIEHKHGFANQVRPVTAPALAARRDVANVPEAVPSDE